MASTVGEDKTTNPVRSFSMYGLKSSCSQHKALVIAGLMSISVNSFSEGYMRGIADAVKSFPSTMKNGLCSASSGAVNLACSSAKTCSSAIEKSVCTATDWVVSATPSSIKAVFDTANPSINGSKLHTYWKSLLVLGTATLGMCKAQQLQQQKDEERFLDGSILDEAAVLRSNVLMNLHKEYMQHLKFYRHAELNKDKATNLQDLKCYIDELKSSFMVLLSNNRTYWEKLVHSLHTMKESITSLTICSHESAEEISTH